MEGRYPTRAPSTPHIRGRIRLTTPARGRRETRSLPTSWSPAFVLALSSRPSNLRGGDPGGTEARAAYAGSLLRMSPGGRGGVPQLPPDRPGDASRMATPVSSPPPPRPLLLARRRKGAFACTFGLGGTT